MASLNEIRSAFIDYFAENGHEPVASSSLVPQNDPTLLFTSAGMVQFKNVFTGLEKRDCNRAVTSQKCLRAGGKHNDLDNVGYTARHHTFFEMLGNFSFGDYFKTEAIPFAWEMITKVYGLPAEKLLVTVYHDDDEAADIWKKVTGFSDSKIIRIATSDNFWAAGPTGPCGPCSEIFYDHGDHIQGGPPGSPDEDGDRFVEIWNLVFMQFDQISEGVRENLPKPSIDTGMGLERIGAVLQGKHDNYDTDLLRALIVAAANAMSTDPDGPGKVHHRVIADHLRATSFMIADGVMPSNEGRGYVLRRIIRRAVRHAHLLGEKDPVMYRLVPSLVAQMGQAFPELGRAQALIEDTLKSEETRFRATLVRGLSLLDDAEASLAADAVLPGETAFKLYDTYGFPLDLTQDAMRERGRSVDTDGFDTAMEEQKAKARAAWTGSGEQADESLWFDLRERSGATEFLGYNGTEAEGMILALVTYGEEVEELTSGQSGILIANQTPFYGEAGGQTGDAGGITADGAKAEVISTTKKLGDLILHDVKVTDGAFKKSQAVQFAVDAPRRTKIAANHSATHLLHEALRAALGEHVAQKGSLVAPERLRFDFVHQQGMKAEEIAQVEREVNGYIRQNSPVVTRVMTPDEAVEEGARALFGEKYGDEVRVVSMGTRPEGDTGPAGDTYSLELCGGTHVVQTGEIGVFAITGEGASSAGIRRIEALTGAAAFDHLAQQDKRLNETALALKAKPEEVPARAKAILDERKALQNEITDLKKRLSVAEANAATGADTGGAEPRDVGGVPFLVQKLNGVSGKDLRGLIDENKARLGSAAILLIAEMDGKVALAAGVTDDLVSKVHAGQMIKTASATMGGKGGGRPDFAQGGGDNPAAIEEAVAAVEAMIAG